MSFRVNWRQYALAAVLALVFMLMSPLAEAADFMPIDEVQPGMQGIAKTVVSGTEIEQFGVEVLGILKDKGPSGDVILVRTYGDVIDRTGGIVQGMSGSPVYIDGKLVGAIAFGWAMTDHKICMVTPIGDMLKLWDMPDTKNQVVSEKFDFGPDETLSGSKAEMTREENQADKSSPKAVESAPQKEQPDKNELKPQSMTLMASGFGERALSMLQDKLKPFHLSVYDTGNMIADPSVKSTPLEPGSSVGVQLVSGDVSVGALGTVTYVEGNKVLAFGHPFLKKGNVGYFMTNAQVFTTVNSLENGFKVGATGENIGLINQDRGAGIAGELGRYPDIIPFRITVRDKDMNREQQAFFQVVDDEDIAPALAVTSVYNFIEKTADRVGPGTAKVSFEISGRNLPGDTLKRENMFYSPVGIGESAVGELFEALSMLASNKYKPVDILDVKVNIDVSQQRSTASIMEAYASVASAKPGDTVNINVKLKPFRGESLMRTVPFTIPKDQESGPMILEVRGGSMVSLSQLLLKTQGLDLDLLKPQKKNKTLETAVKDFADRDRNNDIVVEVLDKELDELVGELSGEKTESKSKDTDKEKNGIKPQEQTDDAAKAAVRKNDKPSVEKSVKATGKVKNYLMTDYIIDGDTQITVEVTK